MDSNYINLENTKRIYALGLKGEFPQMVWVEYDIHPPRKTVPTGWNLEWRVSPPTNHNGHWSTWRPAPTHQRALAFLQTKMPESCEIIVGIKTATVQVRRYDVQAPIGYGDVKVVLDLPGLDEGISAILDHLEAAQ